MREYGNCISYLPSSYLEKPKLVKDKEDTSAKKSLLYSLNNLVRRNKIEPYDHCEELTEIVPDNSRKAYNVLEVIDRICDKDSFMEVQKEFAKT